MRWKTWSACNFLHGVLVLVRPWMGGRLYPSAILPMDSWLLSDVRKKLCSWYIVWHLFGLASTHDEWGVKPNICQTFCSLSEDSVRGLPFILHRVEDLIFKPWLGLAIAIHHSDHGNMESWQLPGVDEWAHSSKEIPVSTSLKRWFGRTLLTGWLPWPEISYILRVLGPSHWVTSIMEVFYRVRVQDPYHWVICIVEASYRVRVRQSIRSTLATENRFVPNSWLHYH